MLLPFVLLYLGGTVLIGLLAARLVHNSGDYVNAGRRIPWLLGSFALFALWFGAETVFGASSEFAEHGLIGVIEDPFGGVLCLLLFGLIFTRKLYRMNLVTLGDLYRNRYGPTVELVASLAMLLTFFGYIAAQLVALGLLLELVAGVSMVQGIWLSTLVVTLYTLAGGMWAISLTDFVQSIFIVLGLGVLAWQLAQQSGGVLPVFAHTEVGFFRFWPQAGWENVLHYFAAWITLGLGSLPSQDIFQRMNASRDEKTAVRSMYTGALIYGVIALLPLFIALAARQLYPELAGNQQLLPRMVLLHAPRWVQVLFFGALLSAIFSTCSGAILAPASILSENIVKPLFRKPLTDKQFLLVLRLSVLLMAILGCWMALARNNIYALVSESSLLGLVTLLVPMFCAIYIPQAKTRGALLAMVAGLVVWYGCAYLLHTQIPALLYGLVASILGMVLGSIKWKVK